MWDKNAIPVQYNTVVAGLPELSGRPAPPRAGPHGSGDGTLLLLLISGRRGCSGSGHPPASANADFERALRGATSRGIDRHCGGVDGKDETRTLPTKTVLI